MSGPVRSLLEKIAARLPVREITGGEGGDDVYLEKYLLFQSRAGRDGFRVHLHRFLRPDKDREVHSHPWAWAWSLVLCGGYLEERRGDADRLEAIARRPGSVYPVWPDTYHRVARLFQRDCWTLFVSGPVVQSWGFWSPDTGEYTPWREFFARKAAVVPSGEYWVERPRA